MGEYFRDSKPNHQILISNRDLRKIGITQDKPYYVFQFVNGSVKSHFLVKSVNEAEKIPPHFTFSKEATSADDVDKVRAYLKSIGSISAAS